MVHNQRHTARIRKAEPTKPTAFASTKRKREEGKRQVGGEDGQQRETKMSWKASLSRHLSVVRFFGCPKSPASRGVM